jgi:hypothetical protein
MFKNKNIQIQNLFRCENIQFLKFLNLKDSYLKMLKFKKKSDVQIWNKLNKEKKNAENLNKTRQMDPKPKRPDKTTNK